MRERSHEALQRWEERSREFVGDFMRIFSPPAFPYLDDGEEEEEDEEALSPVCSSNVSEVCDEEESEDVSGKDNDDDDDGEFHLAEGDLSSDQ